jgi:hypothetical protein
MKRNNLKQQRANAELEAIIEAFGAAMRDANKQYIATTPSGTLGEVPRFTLHMSFVWAKYVDFCARNPS